MSGGCILNSGGVKIDNGDCKRGRERKEESDEREMLSLREREREIKWIK